MSDFGVLLTAKRKLLTHGLHQNLVWHGFFSQTIECIGKSDREGFTVVLSLITICRVRPLTDLEVDRSLAN